jgi:serine/threonine protein phosphatase PrpC
MEPLKQWLRTTVGAGRNRSNSSFVVSPRGEASSQIQLDLERHADEEKIQQQKELIKQRQQQRLEAYDFKTQPQKLFICEIGIVGAAFEQLNEPQLPKIKYLKPRSHRSLWLSGPSQADERNVTLRGVCAARSFSTYPRLHSSRASCVSPSSLSPSSPSSSSSSSASSSTFVSTPLSPYARVGDPNCDSYMVSLDDDGFLVASVADGSNIGNSARDAASLACDTFVSFVRTELRRTDTIEGAGKLLVKALAAAHEAIITSRDDPGSTTLLGGALVELLLEEEPAVLETAGNHSLSSTTSTTTTTTSSSPSSPATSIRKNRKWGFVGLSIGDCRLFHYSASDKKVRDVTEGNYHNLVDIRDPGGRIGATLGTNADVRNLNLFFCPCEEGDVLVLSSDGIYSNMEPQNMGYLPQVFSLPTDSWNDSTFAEQITASKTSFCLGLLMNIFKEANEELVRAFAALEMSTANVGIVTAESGSGGTTENTTSSYGSNGSNYGSNGTKSASSSPFLTPTSSDLGTLVVEKIVTHCLKTTHACRDFVERNPYTKLPTNVVEYPGLMDHSTVLAINVGAFPSCCGLRPLCPFGAASSTSPSSSSSSSSSVSSSLSPASTSPASSAAPSPPTSSKTNNWIPNPTSPVISESEKQRRRGLSLSKKASEKVLIPSLMLNLPEVSRGEDNQGRWKPKRLLSSKHPLLLSFSILWQKTSHNFSTSGLSRPNGSSTQSSFRKDQE